MPSLLRPVPISPPCGGCLLLHQMTFSSSFSRVTELSLVLRPSRSLPVWWRQPFQAAPPELLFSPLHLHTPHLGPPWVLGPTSSPTSLMPDQASLHSTRKSSVCSWILATVGPPSREVRVTETSSRQGSHLASSQAVSKCFPPPCCTALLHAASMMLRSCGHPRAVVGDVGKTKMAVARAPGLSAGAGSSG